MGVHRHCDAALPGAGDPAADALVDEGGIDELLRFLVRRTGDPQLAADLTAETFAAALLARPGERPGAASLRTTALGKLADAQRRGVVERGARRRLGMERLELSAAEAARVAALARAGAAPLWAGRSEGTVPGPVAADHFATRLRAQLGEAAPRAHRRAPPARAAEGRRRRVRTVPAVLAGLALVAVLATVVRSDSDTRTAGPASGPRVVANLALADGLGRTAEVAFGSVWLSATNDEAVLRVDPRTRRVTARIPVGTDVNIGAGAGAIWAVPRRPTRKRARLIRIDPRTNRVVARIPIRSPGARYPLGGAAVVAGPRVWVVGALGLLGVDPRRNRPVRAVVLGGGFLVVGSLLRGGELWVSRADRSITRFDAATGRRLGRVRWPAPSGFVVADGERVVKVGRRSVSVVEPGGGRTMWRTRLGTQLNAAGLVGGRLLVEGANGTSVRDSLWELDPRTGRVLGAMTVPGFTVTTLLRVGREAWLGTADGHVIVVAP